MSLDGQGACVSFAGIKRDERPARRFPRVFPAVQQRGGLAWLQLDVEAIETE